MAQAQSMVRGLVEEARKKLFELMMVDASESIGSVGSVGSAGSVGSVGSVGSAGSVGSVGSAGNTGQAPAIDWESMVDNPTESRVGWSFLDDERTKFAVDGQWWLYERMFKEQKLREQFIDESEGTSRSPKFKKDAAEAYQRHVDRFKELLLILMHICGGGPARAPEILGIRWKNTEQGGI